MPRTPPPRIRPQTQFGRTTFQLPATALGDLCIKMLSFILSILEYAFSVSKFAFYKINVSASSDAEI